MGVLSKKDFLARVNAIIGDNPTDENIALLEDFTDTYNDLETLSKDGAEWKKKYEDNDKQWRKKYVDRFNNADETEQEDEEQEDEKTEEEIEQENVTIDSLFEKEN